MLDVIDSVATLIDVRDKDNLEIALARVMFDLLDAPCLTIWRVAQSGNEVTLRERIRLCTCSNHKSKISETSPIPLAQLREIRVDHKAALGADSYVLDGTDEGGMSRRVFPVVNKSEIVGLVDIEASSPFTAERERLIRGLIKIYRIHLGILEDTDTDELTELSNRKPFEEAFRRATGLSADPLARRDANPQNLPLPVKAELAVVDIDFFKRVNDRFGHPYGDEVLVLLARLMRSSFRDTDRIYRFGGEEFVILMPNTGEDRAGAALERFRRAVETCNFPQVGQITVSIGVTSIRAGDTGSAAFGRADEALYAAKHGGRNKLCRFETLRTEDSCAPQEHAAQEIELF